METEVMTRPSADAGIAHDSGIANDASLTKLYVGSLPYNWTAEHLEEAFKAYGPVASAAVVADQITHRSKGFGFVEFESGSDAKKAMSELNGREIEGRSISVREARPHTERSNGDRDRVASGPRGGLRERYVISTDNTESTDTTGRSYGNRRGWW
jgi:RNA recognition motif-containing protein